MTIKLGVPSKGRLMEKTFDWFAARGVTLTRTGSDREYAGAVHGVDGVALGEPGGCCDEATGDCAIGFEVDCAVTFLGMGSDCAGCAPTTCLFRADAADRSVDGT